MDTNWKPIATAPKDGTYVLICMATNTDRKPIPKDAQGVFIQVASWWTMEGRKDSGEWIVYCSLVQEPTLHFDPTHWMELPDFPDV